MRHRHLEVRPATAAEDLPTLRRGLGFTQVELAGRIGMFQSDLSKLGANWEGFMLGEMRGREGRLMAHIEN